LDFLLKNHNMQENSTAYQYNNGNEKHGAGYKYILVALIIALLLVIMFFIAKNLSQTEVRSCGDGSQGAQAVRGCSKCNGGSDERVCYVIRGQEGVAA
jgi:hypothetical protein